MCAREVVPTKRTNKSFSASRRSRELVARALTGASVFIVGGKPSCPGADKKVNSLRTRILRTAGGVRRTGLPLVAPAPLAPWPKWAPMPQSRLPSARIGLPFTAHTWQSRMRRGSSSFPSAPTIRSSRGETIRTPRQCRAAETGSPRSPRKKAMM